MNIREESILKSKRAGFSLSTVLIASALFGLLVVGVSRFLESTAKNQAGLAIRGAAQDYGTMIKIALAKPDVCKAILDLTDANVAFLPPTVAKPDPVVVNLPRIANVDHVFDKDHPDNPANWLTPTHGAPTDKFVHGRDLILRDVFLSIGPNVAPQVPTSMDYQADLKLILDVNKSERVIGGASHVISIPLILTAKHYNDADLTDLRMVAQTCASVDNDLHYDQICENMGGRWLFSTQDHPEYMLQPRCNMQSDISLDYNEWPNGITSKHPVVIPDHGCTNSVGERISECRYSASGAIKTYNCVSRCGTRSGYRCAYDNFSATPTNKWGIWNFNSAGVPTTLVRACDRGVTVTTRSPSIAKLDWNDDLKLAWEPAAVDTYSLEERNAHLAGPTNCYYVSDADVKQTCNNPTNLKGAVEGGAGSCIWVDHIILAGGSTTAARIAACKAAGGCATMNQSDYSGWIRVSSARAFSVSSPNSVLKEAVGIPCFSVEVNTSNAGDETYSGPDAAQTPDAATYATKANQIAQCKVSDNPPLAGEPATHPNPREAYYICDNPNQSDTISDDSDLKKGMCWKVSNSKLKRNDFSAWTGWVYLLADPPASSLNGSKEYVPPDATMRDYAVPCRGGVRYEP